MSWKTTIIRTASRVGLQLRKHAPEILVGTGILSAVGATGCAINSTLHAQEVIDEHNRLMAKIDQATRLVQNEPDSGLVYTENNREADRQDVYQHTVLMYARLYAPTIILTGVSVACILAGFNILQKRYAATAAAFGTLLTQFNAYRDRVRERYGEDEERDIYHDVVETTVTDDQGKEITERKATVDITDFQFYFDEFSPIWSSDDPRMNVEQLRSAIDRANNQLEQEGHLFLNDLRRMLGLGDTPQGAVLGWIWNEDHPEHCVDLGVFNGTDDPWDFDARTLWDGQNGLLLTPNVDGLIFDKI